MQSIKQLTRAPVLRYLGSLGFKGRASLSRSFSVSKVISNEITEKPVIIEQAKPQEVPQERQTIDISEDIPKIVKEDGTGAEVLEFTKIADLAKSKYVGQPLVDALLKAKFETLTPVQSRSLVPMFKEDKGVVVRAKTGTGKTLAFIIPTLQSIITDMLQNNGRGSPEQYHVHTLVVAPTRDLAFQIQKEYNKVIECLPPKLQRSIGTELCVGGKRSTFNLRRPAAILVATPGRLLDDLSNPKFRAVLSQIDHRVYDEADRLLEVGFEKELNEIDSILKSTREQLHPHLNESFKSILFSATVDKSVDRFAKEQIGSSYNYINCVSKEDGEAHENINQTLVFTENYAETFTSSMQFVIHQMNTNPKFKGLVFLPTVVGSEWFFECMKTAVTQDIVNRKNFPRNNPNIMKLNGSMTQNARDKNVARFKDVKLGLLVCTDVAARGLDFTDVSHVIQVAPSPQIADYVHKVGRTARAGKGGEAIIFLSKAEAPYKNALISKRGINFAEELTAPALLDKHGIEAIPSLLNKVSPSDDELANDLAFSYVGHVKQIASVYRLPFEGLFRDVVMWYQAIVEDNTVIPRFSVRTLRNIGFNERRAREVLDGGAEFFADEENFRYESGGDRRGNDRGNDRRGGGGYGGGNRGGNNRSGGGYNNKSFSNDRNDRGGYKKSFNGNDRPSYKKSYNSDSGRGGYDRENSKRSTGKYQGSRREY